ncbi:MAG: hypothetical protein MJA83_08225, partial [Gammaproteobacteria bacterium]|nr:hypothetical protein [Gammaproteobacteria bacterium]
MFIDSLKRSGIKSVILAAVFCAGWCIAIEDASSETARGVVFDDRNGNGEREAGESGVPGVLVSNGV